MGDNVVNCAGTTECYGYANSQSGRRFGTPDGALSLSNSSFESAYSATAGWDFTTGIGTVDANNLVVNWPSSAQQEATK